MSLDRMVLNINGDERTVICNREKDSLAEVLHELGITGTKTTCEDGQCKGCDVIFDGKLTRSCMLQMKRIKQHSFIKIVD